MKVLHLNPGNLFGGIEVYLLTLFRSRHLCPEMVPAVGVCFDSKPAEEYRKTGVPVHVLGEVRFSRPWTVWNARRRFGRAVAELRPDVVVTHGSWTHALFAPRVRRAGLRLVHAVHGEVFGKHWLERWASRTPPDVVIANSRFTAAMVPSMFPTAPVVVAHPPVPQPVRDRSSDRQRLRADLGVTETDVVILQVSRIEAPKGHAILIRALERLRGVGNWVCWLVGGPQRPAEEVLYEQLREQATQAGLADRIRFLGSRGDVPALMSAADLYCQPNTGPEGFGLTYIEALAAGLPVVTSAVGAAVELVDPSCGVLNPPNDAEAVADSLASLIQNGDLRRSLGGAGPKRADELCDPARQLGAFMKAIR